MDKIQSEDLYRRLVWGIERISEALEKANELQTEKNRMAREESLRARPAQPTLGRRGNV